MEAIDERLQRIWRRMSPRQRYQLVRIAEVIAGGPDTEVLPGMAADEGLDPVMSPARASFSRRLEYATLASPPPRMETEGVHALLKLGMARNPDGSVVTATDTIKCLDLAVSRGERPTYLGTNSQAVSEKFRRLIKRLYIMSDEDEDYDYRRQSRPRGGRSITRVVDVGDVLNQWDFDSIARRQEVNVCPEDLTVARTWFKVERVWRVLRSPSADDIFLMKTGESIAHAVSAGRATFFYVRPVEFLDMEPVV